MPFASIEETSSGKQNATRSLSEDAVTPSYDAIAKHAWRIWKNGGCQPGQDEHNRFEAVAQLETAPLSC
ncbi:MAG: DUF2934 domain-containing protein [Planctomycetes bacterium]|nr:DUF2934 domain-containing protein [Planctomycetota bacterium]